MKISVIIPAFNEEKYLPGLLTDLKDQTFRDFEIIVSDAGSTDKTVEIAQEYGARVIKGGMPAVGRNNGAKAALGDFLYFFDSDVRIPKKFLETTYEEIEDKFLDIATCELVPDSDNSFDKLLHNFSNTAVKVSQYFDPHAPGCCILISKRLFNRLNGFDETLKLAEDHDLVKRASKFRTLTMLDAGFVTVSTRRLDSEGRAQIINKYIKVELYRFFKGEITDDIIEYEFGNFDKNKNNPDSSKKIKKVSVQIEKLNSKYEEFLSYFKEQNVEEKEKNKKLHNLESQFDKMKKSFKEIFGMKE